MNELSIFELRMITIYLVLAILAAGILVRNGLILGLREQERQREDYNLHNRVYLDNQIKLLNIHTGNFSNKFAQDTKQYIDKMIAEANKKATYNPEKIRLDEQILNSGPVGRPKSISKRHKKSRTIRKKAIRKES